MTSLVAISRFFTTSEVLPKDMVNRVRLAIVLLAVALPLSDVPGARDSLSVPGSLSVFPSDVLVLAAVVLWAGERLFARESIPLASSPVLRWPLLLFGLSLVPGIVRGHERYGETLIGQPVRLVLYAAIGLALLKLRARDVYWGIVLVLYAGTAWQLVLAGYSIATGSHQTSAYLLSTGGSRVLSLGAGMYLAAAFLIALLNVEFDRGRRRWLHLGVAGLALVAEALTFGRTTYIALALLIPVVFLTLRETRTFVLRKWPVWVAFAVVAVAAAALTPSVGSTLVDRVTANPLNDSTVRWRVGSFEATLSGFKSGQWKAAETADGDNRLSDPSFEHPPIQDWHIQGGTMASVRVGFPTFQERALRFETDGTAFDEGPYSNPVLTHVGQTWKFAVWLRGAQGGELLNVGIWEYGTDGSHTGYANLPVTLTSEMTYHTIQVTVTDPATTYIRAILRTRSDPQKATVYADQAFVLSVPQLVPVDPAQNLLSNPSFEDGTAGWLIQGGELTFGLADNNRFGKLAGQMTTHGDAVDEGMYSEAFPARKGDKWTFSIWLKGAEGHEVVAVELWEYGAHGETTLETVSPYVLSYTMQRYFVQAKIWRPDTTEIRALVRTWDSPQAVDVVMDQASLTKALGSQPAQAAGGQPTRPAAADESWTWEEPLLGLGFGRSFNYIWNGAAYHLQGDPHNSYIWILAGSGVFALAALLLLFGTFLWDAIRRVRAAISFERALVLWAIGTWFIFMVNTLTGPILSEPSFLLTVWIVLLLPALVSARRPRREFQ
jgi:O-antigen ligase